MKKFRMIFLLVTLMLVLVQTTCIFAYTEPFKDVKKTKYEASVMALTELGIVNGYTDNTYRPSSPVTRVELIKTIVLASGLEKVAEISKREPIFIDCSDSGVSWAYGYINAATEYGYLPPVSGDKLRPSDNATIEDMEVICLRALGYKSIVESTSGDIFARYHAKAKELDLLRDVSYKSVQDKLTRGNLAIILWNALRTETWGFNDGATMIDRYFDDYSYYPEVMLNTIQISNDGTISFQCNDKNVNGYRLVQADLIKMLPGLRMALLTNDKDKEIVHVEILDSVVEGKIEAGKINGVSYHFDTMPSDESFVVLIPDGKDVVSYAVIPQETEVLLDNDLIEDLIDKDEEQEGIYLIDGRIKFVDDLREKDVMVKVTNFGAVQGSFYLVARNVSKGTYQSFVTKGSEKFLEVDGERIPIIDQTRIYEYDSNLKRYIQIPEEYLSKQGNKYIGEEVEVACDYFGNAIEVYFDEIEDVEETSEAIEGLLDLGVVNKYADGTFRPEMTVTRAELIKDIVLIMRLDAAADVSKGKTRFEDVNTSHWATGYINVADNYQVLPTQSTETQLAPDSNATVQDVLVCAVRTLGYQSIVESKEGSFSQKYVDKARELGLLKNVAETTYTKPVTRKDLCQILWNALHTKIWEVTSENGSTSSSKTLFVKFYDQNGMTEATKPNGTIVNEYQTVDMEYEERLKVTFGSYDRIKTVKYRWDSDTWGSDRSSNLKRNKGYLNFTVDTDLEENKEHKLEIWVTYQYDTERTLVYQIKTPKASTPTPTPTPSQTPTTSGEEVTYVITASVEGHGKISPSGETNVKEGSRQKYTITPDKGYQVRIVLVDGESVGQVTSYTFKNVDEKHTIVAKFEKEEESGEQEKAPEEKKEEPIKKISEKYHDVDENEWYVSAVKYATEHNLMNGVSETEFAPRKQMTRGMLVTVLYRASNSTGKDLPSFVDVEKDQYYANPIAWAAQNGIVNGIGENQFGPNHNITREQIVTILYRYAKWKDSSIQDMEGVMGLAGYVDYMEISDFATNAFRWAIHEGIINGKSDGNLAPKDLATRAEVATMLMRFLEK